MEKHKKINLKTQRLKKQALFFKKNPKQLKSNFKEYSKPDNLVCYSFQVCEQNQEIGYDPLLYVTSLKM